jgi:site-specific DNA recombinase
MNLAIYVRVSTVTQIDNTSLDAQVELCKQKARELGFSDSNIIVYREEGVSGEDVDVRPEMMRLREDVASGIISHVICTHPDRFSRDMTDKLIVVREFEKNGADISFTDADFNKSPEGILFFNIISAIANYELSLIRKRTVRGRERAVKEGQKVMPMRVAPFGYDKDGEGQLVINKKEAQYVKMIYEWYIYENLTLRQIGERLYEAGVPPKRSESKNWSASSIGRILTSEIYIGNYYYNRRKTEKVKGKMTKSGKPKKTIGMREEGEWIKVAVPSIVDEALYELAQRQKVKNTTTNRQVGNKKHEFLLKSILKCGHCGRTWDATTYGGGMDKETGERKVYRCYRCPNLSPKKYGPEVVKCPSQSLRADLIEEFVWNEVYQLVSEPERFMKVVREQSGDGGVEEIKRRIDLLQRELTSREKEKDKIKTMFRREVISEDEMVDDIMRVNQEHKRIADQMSKYQAQIEASAKEGMTLDKMYDMINYVRTQMKALKDLTYDFKRHIIVSLFDEIFVKLEGDELVITSVGAFDKLMNARNETVATSENGIMGNLGLCTHSKEI